MSEEDVDVYCYYLSRPGSLTAALNWYRAMITGSDVGFKLQLVCCPSVHCVHVHGSA